MEKENLLQKLKEKWTNFRHAVGHSKIVKSLATCALASGIALSAAGCHIYIVPDPPVDQTENNTDLNNGNNQGNEQSGNNQGNQNEQGGNTNQPTTPPEPDYSQYSQLLQDVLKSDYYNDLADKHFSNQLKLPGLADAGANLIENIPYTFLESQGEDIEAIKNNEIYTYCFNYVNNENKNELFTNIRMMFGEDKKTQYYKIYLIKHEITDKELEDFSMLTEEKYIQANFFIQELDNQREAELVNEFCINANAYEELLQQFNRIDNNVIQNFNSQKINNFIIKDISKTGEYTFCLDLDLIAGTSNPGPVSYGEISPITINIDELNSSSSYRNGIFNLKHGYFNIEELSSPTPITYFANYIVKQNNFIK